MSKLILVPAYGRDYKSKQEVQAAWDSGQDFYVRDPSSQWDRSYVNAGDDRGASVQIHFNAGHDLLNLKKADDIGGWDTGMVDTENGVWETGEVVSREEDGGGDIEIGDGSQVPPARDDFGNQLNEEGEPMEESIPRVAGTEAGWELLAQHVQKAHRS